MAGGPAALECKMTEIIHLSGDSNFAVFGEVVGIHMRDDCIVNGRFDLRTYNPVSRLGYRDYAVIKEYFELMFRYFILNAFLKVYLFFLSG